MLEVAKEGVRSGQTAVFGGREQALVVETRERQQRAALLHPGLASAMKALQTLHQELDVANAAGRQLDVEAGLAGTPGGELFADAQARGGDRFHGRKVEAGCVGERSGVVQKRLSGGPVARRYPRLDEHLQLPIARALLVVRLRAVE